MTVQEALVWAHQTLRKAQVESFQLDSEVLLAHILKQPRVFLLTHPEDSPSEKELKSYQKLIKKRATHCPVAYLTGSREFFGRNFLVTPDVLIPRPETELLVETALEKAHLEIKKANHKKEVDLAEIGTGSGCIILSLLGELTLSLKASQFNYYATDASPRALAIAQKNYRRLFTNKNPVSIKFLPGNLLEPLTPHLFPTTSSNIIPIKSRPQIKEKVLFLLANLPYLSAQEYQAAPSTVTKYEPSNALLSDQQGLAHYRELFSQLQTHLSNAPFKSSSYSKILIFLEFSPSQKEKLEQLAQVSFSNLPNHSLKEIRFYQDLAKKWRLVKLELLTK